MKSKNKNEKIQWHEPFYAALELDFHEDKEELTFEREVELGKNPVRMDMLILHNNSEKQLKSELGHIMRRVNVIEYKSPEDGLNIDDFYKTIGYAFMYKALQKHVNLVPVEDLTVSIFRDTRSQKMIDMLKSEGYNLEEKYPGIIYVTGHIPIPVQIVSISELPERCHSGLKILKRNAIQEEIEYFLNEWEDDCDVDDKRNIGTVVRSSSLANEKIFEILRSGGMESIIDRWINEGAAKSVEENNIKHIKSVMSEFNVTVEKAMDALKIPKGERASLKEKLELAEA